MKFPSKPAKGDRVLQSIYNSLIEVIDYLPTLSVVGDNKTTYVNHSAFGTTIHAVQPHSTIQGNANEYIAGSGIVITSGNVINAKLSAGPNINIDYNSGWLVISGTPAGSGSSGGGGDCSGVGFPDYAQLYNGNYSMTSGIGISWLLPVSAGITYRYYTDAVLNDGEQDVTVAYGTYAPSIGTTGDSRREIDNGEEFVPSANGWMRLSVFDNGLNGGACLRFYQGEDVDGQYATPLYRFHNFTDFQAGAGIAIETGVIRNMIQTDHNELVNGSGIVSTGLYTGNPYNPTLTGIAIGLSTAWAQDLTTINNRSSLVNKVLSSQNGNLVWADNVQIPPPVGADFKAPDFAKLQVANDAGEQALGLGNTFIIPVSGGSTVRYSADGGTIIARWAPVKGSNKNAFDVTTTNQTTTDDGYVRISVIDPGTLEYGCLRLYVDNKDIPLHKFAKFNYSSGAIYEAGRYMQIQTTSTTINPQTELEEEYTLENPIIHNMLTGGNYITIQQTEMVDGVEQELKYPRINCTLTGDNSTVFINDGVISARATSPNWTSLTPDLLSVDNTNHTLSAATQGGGGGFMSGGFPYYGHRVTILDSNYQDGRIDSENPVTCTFLQPVWIIGNAQMGTSNYTQSIQLVINPDSQNERYYHSLAHACLPDDLPYGYELSVPASIPIPANTPIRFYIEEGDIPPTIFYRYVAVYCREQ